MSSDNGIYIAKFKDGTYRVTHAQGIENVDYPPMGSQEQKEVLKSYFGKSPVFLKHTDALHYAHDLGKEYDYLEYGICGLIPIYPNWVEADVKLVRPVYEQATRFRFKAIHPSTGVKMQVVEIGWVFGEPERVDCLDPVTGDLVTMVRPVLLQSTGIKDVGGTEIYEGDELEGHFHGIVVWDYSGWSLKNDETETTFEDMLCCDREKLKIKLTT